MKFIIQTLPTIRATDEERKALRPIGRNGESYQRMLDEVVELVQVAEDAGFWGLSTTEHHFHSEGLETSVDSAMLALYIAERTKRLMVGPIGYVLPTWDPIRLAEQTAMVDQMTKGRHLVGMARGYQHRWGNVLGQKYFDGGPPEDMGEREQFNTKTFEEMYRILKMAWTQDTVEFKGERYQVPFPFDNGITNWPAQKLTSTYGAPGELDQDGVIRRVCVVPKPYQQPHPILFQAFSTSESTLRFSAKEGLIPIIVSCWPPKYRRHVEIYREAAVEAGYNWAHGQNTGAVRGIHLGKTTEEAYHLFETYHVKTWRDGLAPFRFFEAFRGAYPEDETKYPLSEGVFLPVEEWKPQRMIDHRYEYLGTVDEVKRQFEEHLVKVGNPDYFLWFCDQGVMPQDQLKQQIEMFGELIKEFGD